MARRPRTALAAAVLALLAAAPAAHADAFDRVFREYQTTGAIDPCKHSQADLEEARREVPNDVEAYAPDFPNALQGALEQRAAGACAKAPAGGADETGGAAAPTPGATPTTPSPPGTPPPGSTVTPAPQPDPTPAPAAGDSAIARSALAADESGAGAPAPVVALGLLGALLALGGLAYGLAHWLAWDPRWARRARHSLAEAGWRTGNTWSEFADWVRLGR